MKKYYVYILTNHSNRVLYTGVTNDIIRRTFEHRNKLAQGFAERYKTYKVVYVEEYTKHVDAITREKQIKGWLRSKKIDLINSLNPEWNDLLTE